MADLTLSGNTLRGMVFMAGATLSNAVMSVMVRQMASDLPPLEIAFFRALFGALAFIPLLAHYGFDPLRTSRFGLHALRGVLNVFTMVTYFVALSMTPFATVAAIDFLAPLFATALAVMFLGEIIRARRIIALLIGFAGGLAVVRPGFIEISTGVVFALSSTFVWSIILIILKNLTRTESSITATLYMALFSAPLTLIVALPVWQTPALADFPWLIAIGVCGTTTHLCVAQALKEADAGAVLPANFLRLIWAALFGFLFFGEIPDLWTWIGGIMIFGAVVYITYRERQLALRPTPTPTPSV
jgi:drug/metabolite transporter (DMT)-like permease